MAIAAEELRPLTIDDLAGFPDDGLRREIVLGELIVTPAPSPMHQVITTRLARILGNFIEQHGLGTLMTAPVDVKFGEHSVVQPDIVFVSTENSDRIGDKYIDGLPDLVVEVLSPATRRTDLVRKMALYADAGVPEYWVVDLDKKTLAVLQLEGEHYVQRRGTTAGVQSSVLAGIGVDLEQLFASPTPARF